MSESESRKTGEGGGFAEQIFFQKAESHRLQGRTREALDICLAGLERMPDSLAGRFLLGKCYLELGQKNQAKEELEKVAREIESCLSVYSLLSQLYLEERNAEKALEALRRSLYFSSSSAGGGVTPMELDLLHRPRPPFSTPAGKSEAGGAERAAILTDTLAEIYTKQGHWQKALRIYEDLLALQPQDPRLKKKCAALKRKIEGKPGPREALVGRLEKWLAAVQARTEPASGTPGDKA